MCRRGSSLVEVFVVTTVLAAFVLPPTVSNEQNEPSTPRPARILDNLLAASIKARDDGGGPLTSVKVKRKFPVDVVVTVNERFDGKEIVGQVQSRSNRPGRTVILQSAGWIGRRVAPNRFTGTAILDFQAKGANHTIVISIKGKVVAESAMEVTE